MKTRYIFMFFILLIMGCNNDAIDYNYYKVEVDSTQHIHWWSGYYKMNIYYHFTLNGSLIQGKYLDNNKYHIWSASYCAGDSIIIKCPSNNPYESEVLKRTYIRKKNYQVP